MKSRVKKSALVLFSMMPVITWAHPGHGHENPLSPGHYVANPEHFIPLALTVVVSLVLIGLYRVYVMKHTK